MTAESGIEGVVSDLTFCNVAYVLRKTLGNAQLRNGLRVLKTYDGCSSQRSSHYGRDRE